MLEIVKDMEEYIENSGRAKTKVAREAGINPDTFRKYFSSSEKTRSNPSPENQEKMRNFLERKRNGKANIPYEERLRLEGKIQRIELLLFMIEHELSEFRDGPKEFRDLLREKLNLKDSGYVTALLTNMQDERHFQQWKGADIKYNNFNLKFDDRRKNRG